MDQFSGGRSMWIVVFFDLPTETKKDRKDYVGFRKGLLKNGFSMMQYSVYTRHCSSRESSDVHTQRVQRLLPDKGLVSILRVTEKQFADIKNFWGQKRRKNLPSPKQLEMF